MAERGLKILVSLVRFWPWEPSLSRPYKILSRHENPCRKHIESSRRQIASTPRSDAPSEP